MTAGIMRGRCRAFCAVLAGMSVVAHVTIPSRAANASLVAGASPGATARAKPYAAFVAEAASRFAVPAHWIDAVITAESLGDANALSAKGAMGLMQIMPATWADLRAHYALGVDPYDPHDNIMAGTAYLRELYDRYGPDGFLAAYHAGPGRYEDYLAGRSLPPETRRYVAHVSRLIGEDGHLNRALAAAIPSSRPVSRLFPVHKDGTPAVTRTAADQPSDRTPAAQSVQSPFPLAPQSTGLFVPPSRKGLQP